MRKQRTNLPPGFKKIGPTTWMEIWRRWQRVEGRLTKWRPHFRREGFRTWAEWREAVVVAPFDLTRRQWSVYRVTDAQVIPTWSGGPFPRWIAGPYRGAQTRTFRWLASTGRTNEDVRTRTIQKLPTTMFMFGLRYRGKIVILDGMHRCAEITRRVQRGEPVPVTITLAVANVKKLPKVKPWLR